MCIYKRKYYLLEKAAQYINNALSKEEYIDVDDILHFASHDQIQLCVRLCVNQPSSIYAFIDKIPIHIWEKLEQRDENYRFFFNCKYGDVSLTPLPKSLDVDIEKGDFNSSVSYADIIMAITNSFINDIQIQKHKKLAVEYLYLPGEESFLDDEFEFDLNIIECKEPFIFEVDELIITTEELDNFITKLKNTTQKDITFKSEVVGRKENILKKDILDIAKATREKYPNCTGNSLATKIHTFLSNHNAPPAFGTIKEYISRNLLAPQDKNTKLNYDLVIPEHLKHLKK